uniref:Macaca fascicularis brain cDNA clone: QflA-19482, similar to human pyruvate dehydrogenase phosphatase isoenzyme 2 (PDP2), mRNA, RefSeq: NM_020786.1 n=1 Tax=Macaca fascicularis TaxID=9541 RepID=I7GIF7_MACFA|nr:unnamed protein product [Macaca fascicularis]
MSVLLKLIHKFNVFFIKRPGGFFVDIGKIITSCMWKYRETRIAKLN